MFRVFDQEYHGYHGFMVIVIRPQQYLTMFHVFVLKYHGFMVIVTRPQQAPVGCDLPSVQLKVRRHKQRRRHRQALGRKNR